MPLPINSLNCSGLRSFIMPCVNPTLFGVRSLPTRPAKFWKSMVKLFKTALHRVLHNTRRMPSLIELQTFFSDAVRTVNDRALTTLSDQPNDLTPISPSSFLGKIWHRTRPWVSAITQGIFAGIICTILPWPIVFGWGGCSPTFPLNRDETNGGSSRKT